MDEWLDPRGASLMDEWIAGLRIPCFLRSHSYYLISTSHNYYFCVGINSYFCLKLHQSHLPWKQVFSILECQWHCVWSRRGTMGCFLTGDVWMDHLLGDGRTGE